ncbi:hypothetical protein LTR70_002927 [Exophiala xenobiotica]|uniref:Short chain dehydrogenase/reductase n=1 Tax=Lithohypha guttulata TaxID=1690604 RepID=A0ABR0KHK2_9EURO|nr:hypothetical protein LTR24_002465 [Lithohypha guttulata]KAK5324480.1 hypothetical protein LTR70_002927 [Exophiala xenobiotica]
MTTFFRQGATALISGGASGVGFAMAQLCRKHGMHVALIDYNSSNLQAAHKALDTSNSDLKTEIYPLDVGDLSAWKSILPKFQSAFPSLDLLMLNAGTSVKPSTTQVYEDVDYFHQTLNTNMYGVINGLSVFLPLLQQSAKSASSSGKGSHGVIITGSKQGITNPPGAGNPAYNMSKAAIKTLAEHLAHDLRTETSPTHCPNVSVHLLIPGWTFTGLSGNPGPAPTEAQLAKKNEGAWLPAQVAEYAERKIGEGKFYIVCPDNDVDEALDMARMEWAIGDVVQGRSALSRWDNEYAEGAAEGIKKRAEELRG